MNLLQKGFSSVLGRGPRGKVALAVAAIVVAAVATAGLLVFGGDGRPVPNGADGAGSGPLTPSGTGVVARLPFDGFSAFSWAPDGAHLLISSQSSSRVYDRFGGLVSQFGRAEGWLDAGHLIADDGSVADIHRSQSSGPGSNSGVVANGYGSAAIIVARPGCVGDPIVDWYRDGKYVRTNEKVTPYGWSFDGQLVLKGHMDCSSADAQLHGWKGPVDVVDFATGRVDATAPAVRGEMAFSPDESMLAAQSDADLEIVELDGGSVETLPGIRFLGWLDAETLYAASGSQLELVDLDPLAVMPVEGNEWQAESPTGLHISADFTGAARRIVAADGTTLMGLASEGLAAERYPTANEPVGTALQPDWWSPDGRMLALQSRDGNSLVLLSVDPAKPGAS